MKAKVSILVPCYNVEKFLPQCLDSVVNQTLQDIEIICINDGSTDSTLNIIKKYASKDPRIKIIDKENDGYGKSMNRGLDVATGEYIGIVESDDWVERDAFEFLYNIAAKHDVDIAKAEFVFFDSDTGVETPSWGIGMPKKLEYNYMDSRQKSKLRHIVFHNPLSFILYTINMLLSPLYRTRIRNGARVHYLFHKIPIKNK